MIAWYSRAKSSLSRPISCSRVNFARPSRVTSSSAMTGVFVCLSCIVVLRYKALLAEYQSAALARTLLAPRTGKITHGDLGLGRPRAGRFVSGSRKPRVTFGLYRFHGRGMALGGTFCPHGFFGSRRPFAGCALLGGRVRLLGERRAGRRRFTLPLQSRVNRLGALRGRGALRRLAVPARISPRGALARSFRGLAFGGRRQIDPGPPCFR